MPAYSGLLVRDNFADVGQIPTTGNLWTAPDIIPYHNNVLTPEVAASTYSRDIGLDVVSNLNNNVYTRCRNISGAAMTGTANLFYADASLFLLPATWTRIVLPGASVDLVDTATGLTSIAANNIALTQAPFTMAGVPANAHYCFITVVNNNGIPFPVPQTFASNAEFAVWVQNNPNVAYRNIAYNRGSSSNVTSYQRFGNANPVASTMIYNMTGTGLPQNTTWQASCADSRLSAPFSATGTFSSSGTAGTSLQVPANIAGT